MSNQPVASVTTYQRLRVLGRGGMGEVFLARQAGVEGFQRLVALKRILPEHAGDEKFRQMFIAEARVMAGLRHPNICQTVDLREIDGDLFLILEYLEGVSLSDLIQSVGPLPPRLVGGVLVGVCQGLQHAHSAGVIHRDISPSNVFLTTAGEIKILDFGVAKLVDSGTTATGLKGKGPYMSPEQISGEKIDARSDLFSLGAVGFEALIGECLFRRSTDYLTFRAILTDERPRRASPSPIDEVLVRCLAVTRDARFESGADLARAIERALQPHGGTTSALELIDYLNETVGDLVEEATTRTREAIAQPQPAQSEIVRTVAVLPEAEEIGSRGGARRWLIAGAVLLVLGMAGVYALGGGGGSPPSGDEPKESDASADATPPLAIAPSLDAEAAVGEPVDATPLALTVGAADAAPTPSRTRSAAERGTGFLSIDSRPYATITVDGKTLGNTPIIKHRLKSGTHRVVARSSSGATKRIQVKIRRGKTTVKKLSFK